MLAAIAFSNCRNEKNRLSHVDLENIKQKIAAIEHKTDALNKITAANSSVSDHESVLSELSDSIFKVWNRCGFTADHNNSAPLNVWVESIKMCSLDVKRDRTSFGGFTSGNVGNGP